MSQKQSLNEVIEKQHGILFAKPAMVSRIAYSGRGILADNIAFTPDRVDERGYLPVEWWIMSCTEAENDVRKQGEGLTSLLVNDEEILLRDVFDQIPGASVYYNSWPLTKILDIGGNPVPTTTPGKSGEEVPPIPAHVHSGIVQNGKLVGPGKLEAYFFPPVDVPPYNASFGEVFTRLGLMTHINRHHLSFALSRFGKDDAMYHLCNRYSIRAYDGWTIPPGIVHAPGPWITFEIQRPQDDYNLLGWRFGEQLSDEEREEKRKQLLLRGLRDEQDVLDQAIDFDASTHPQFKRLHYRPSTVIEKGTWGRRLQIFFDEFYGEAIELRPHESYERKEDSRPFAGIVWSGQGTINANSLDATVAEKKEFFVTPATRVRVENTGITPLLVYTVFPIQSREVREGRWL